MLSTLSNFIPSLDYAKGHINTPQAADACAGYPVIHYNLSFGSSNVNQSILTLGPYTSNGAPRVEETLNSSDGICQNVRYHFHILAVNIIGSSTSSDMEFCKN